MLNYQREWRLNLWHPVTMIHTIITFLPGLTSMCSQFKAQGFRAASSRSNEMTSLWKNPAEFACYSWQFAKGRCTWDHILRVWEVASGRCHVEQWSIEEFGDLIVFRCRVRVFGFYLSQLAPSPPRPSLLLLLRYGKLAASLDLAGPEHHARQSVTYDSELGTWSCLPTGAHLRQGARNVKKDTSLIEFDEFDW